jgi:hypothetical protein
MFILQGRPGAVIALDDPAVQCTTRLLGLDPDVTFGNQRSIITRMTVSQKVNVQFLHTLGDLIYVYVFGDRMGSICLSGLAFNCGCTKEGTPPDGGAEQMLLWYRQNRASRRPNPVRVTVGRTNIEGFVVNFTEDVVDPSLNLVQWGVDLAALPEDAAA